MPAAPGKICIVCGQDCSDRPRVKDAAGRYCCKACEAARAAARAPSVAVPAPASAPAEEGDAYDLMPEGLLGDGPAPCPECGQPILAGSVVCLHCGFDTQKGFKHQVGTGVDDPDDLSSLPVKGKPAAAKCPDCGYDLAGLKTPRCPECGKLVLKKSLRETFAEDSRRAARDAWQKPLIMIGVGLAGVATWQLIADPTGRKLFISLLNIGVQVPIGLTVYFLCCLAWIGFDMPWRYITLRLIAVYAVTSLVKLPVDHIPVGMVRLGIMVIVYIGLLMDMLDLDVQDAAIVAVATVIANLFIVLTLVMWLTGLI